MKPTKGKLNIIERRRNLKDGRESVDLFCRPSPVSISPLDWDFIAGKVALNDASLIVEAWNACVEINPANPIAAAAAMPKIFRLLSEAVVDAAKVTHKTLDPEKWLREANDVILAAASAKD